jgi:hypothetical protein
MYVIEIKIVNSFLCGKGRKKRGKYKSGFYPEYAENK